MKLAVVGGGSTYTPELVDGIGRLRDLLPVEELVLVDPDAERLELVGGFGRRILSHLGHPATLTTTTTLEPALDGVDAVLLQLRVGGQAARAQDETWPLECGCVGQETTGAGGLAKALRTVPVVLDIAERVRAAAPDAWIVDFTNPVGIVTRALLQEGHRAVGLCNVAIGFQRRFAAMLDVAPDDVALDHVGLNHLTWERAVRVGGTDRLPEILDRHGAELAAAIERFRPDLALTPPAVDAIGLVLREPPLSWWGRPFYDAIAGAAVATLPDWAREMVGAARRPWHLPVGRATLAGVGWVMGGTADRA